MTFVISMPVVPCLSVDSVLGPATATKKQDGVKCVTRWVGVHRAESIWDPTTGSWFM